jgi:GntR family transcriptional regulator
MDDYFRPVAVPRKLVTDVISTLRRAIREGAFSATNEMPTEPELARQLRVSRGTLRQAMAILEEEGILRRRQGIGTSIVPHAGRLRDVLNNNLGVSEMIRNTGGKPGTSRLTINRAAAEDVIAEKLGVKPGEPLAMIERVRTDNEVPVAVTIDYLPLSLLKSRGLSLQNLEAALKEQGSLYLCLRAVGLTIDGAIADIRSVVADRDVASALQLKPNTPVLMLCQTDYAADVPVIYSKQYQPSDVTVQVWRKGPG